MDIKLYQNKYNKYKNKYLILKKNNNFDNIEGGGIIGNMTSKLTSKLTSLKSYCLNDKYDFTKPKEVDKMYGTLNKCVLKLTDLLEKLKKYIDTNLFHVINKYIFNKDFDDIKKHINDSYNGIQIYTIIYTVYKEFTYIIMFIKDIYDKFFNFTISYNKESLNNNIIKKLINIITKLYNIYLVNWDIFSDKFIILFKNMYLPISIEYQQIKMYINFILNTNNIQIITIFDNIIKFFKDKFEINCENIKDDNTILKELCEITDVNTKLHNENIDNDLTYNFELKQKLNNKEVQFIKDFLKLFNILWNFIQYFNEYNLLNKGLSLCNVKNYNDNTLYNQIKDEIINILIKIDNVILKLNTHLSVPPPVSAPAAAEAAPAAPEATPAAVITTYINNINPIKIKNICDIFNALLNNSLDGITKYIEYNSIYIQNKIKKHTYFNKDLKMHKIDPDLPVDNDNQQKKIISKKDKDVDVDVNIELENIINYYYNIYNYLFEDKNLNTKSRYDIFKDKVFKTKTDNKTLLENLKNLITYQFDTNIQIDDNISSCTLEKLDKLVHNYNPYSFLSNYDYKSYKYFKEHKN